MSETEVLLAAGKAALRTVRVRDGASAPPELHVVEDPAAWHAGGVPEGPAIAMTPLLAGRLAEGGDFMGPEDPEVAGQWAGHGLPDAGVEAMRRLVVPHGWSMERVQRAAPARGAVLRLGSVTQMALCRAVTAGVPVVFDAPVPGPEALARQPVIITGTAREACLEDVLSQRVPARMARFVLTPEAWARAGAPLFGRAEFQFSQVLACDGPGEILRDVLDDWICAMRGRVEVALWPPGSGDTLGPLGAMASGQVARTLAPGTPAQVVTLGAGQWLVVPHGWFRQVRPVEGTVRAAVLRHSWRF